MVKNNAKRKRIGLALGGGGAKGLAHVGVIKALEQARIPIDFIAGTSMGAVVGGWYALTEDTQFLDNLFLNIKTRDIFPLGEVIRKRAGSFFHGESVAKLLETHFKKARVEDCRIPFRAVATNARNGEETVFAKGFLSEVARASSALPIIFSPVKIGNEFFIDGGLSNPVPADVVRQMGAEYVIAVDVSSKWISTPQEVLETRDLFETLYSAISVIEYQLARRVLGEADMVLRPPVMHLTWAQFGRTKEIVDIGREETELHIKEIRKGVGLVEPPKTLGEKFMEFLIHEERT